MSIKCRVASCAYNNRAEKCVLKKLSIDEDGRCGDFLIADYSKLSPLIHFYYFSKNGVYCRIRHKLINDVGECTGCSLAVGSLQGEGVECEWDDVFERGFMRFYDPKRELLRVSNLIETGCFGRYPTITGEQCHKYTIYAENYKRAVAEGGASPQLYTEEQMISWPDDADEDEVAAFFRGELE